MRFLSIFDANAPRIFAKFEPSGFVSNFNWCRCAREGATADRFFPAATQYYRCPVI
jgi:hypothetical protein